jgi:hypothetical protein
MAAADVVGDAGERATQASGRRRRRPYRRGVGVAKALNLLNSLNLLKVRKLGEQGTMSIFGRREARGASKGEGE